MFSFKSPKNDLLICRFLILLDSRSGFPNHHGPCRYTRSLDPIGKVAVETVLGVSTERFGHPSEFLGGRKSSIDSVMIWDIEKSKILSWLYGWEESEFKETTNGQFCAGNHWWPLVIPIELLQSPSPQSHVWGWRARNSMTSKCLTIFRKKKLLCHAYWFPSSSVRTWIPLTSETHFCCRSTSWRLLLCGCSKVAWRMWGKDWWHFTEGPFLPVHCNGCLTL